MLHTRKNAGWFASSLVLCCVLTTSCRKDMASAHRTEAPAQPQTAPTKASAPATAGKAGGGDQGATEKAALGPVDLQAQPAHGTIERFPLVLAGPAVTQAVADKINAALKREQATVEAAAEQCKEDYREQVHKTPSTGDLWTRGVLVTMKGPHYLALDAVDSYFCGGAYPQDTEEPLVYDLTTGSPVNWIKLFPAGARPSRGTGSDGSVTGDVLWPVLARRAVGSSTGECEGAYEADVPIPFAVSLHAREGQLQADAYDVAHAIANCEDIETFTPDQLRKAGFAPELADALEAAHRLQH